MKIPFTPTLRAFAGLAFIGSSLLSAQAPQSANGESLFVQNCAFCHGRDTGGGETGPDLTRSKLVADDVGGDKIGPVIVNGRQEKGMPRFKLGDQEVKDLAVYIHAQKKLAESQKGGRRGVDVADLQTGNADAGKKYFNGAGKCAGCHSPSGDLAGVAGRYQGLKLEERMLYPHGNSANIVVTLASGEKLTGKVAYQDEFTIGMRDSNGWYHSWPASSVKFKIDAPADVHAELLAQYSDDDVHDLMAYLQTLR
jgi:cytochrome c oxidase cbb3-type subunit 3